LKKDTTLIVSAVIALVLALMITVRVTLLRKDFNRTVKRSLKTTAGYDKSFIGMVDRLEHELATRASFGYQGGKDPMTGSVRQVVPPPPAARAPYRAPAAVSAAQERRIEAPPPATDPVKLTAIIFDNKSNQYTAIVMDGERSFSLEVGDRVRDRVIRKITNEIIIMEDAVQFYKYDIFGKCVTKRK